MSEMSYFYHINYNKQFSIFFQNHSQFYIFIKFIKNSNKLYELKYAVLHFAKGTKFIKNNYLYNFTEHKSQSYTQH
jgi:hypothetical protein